MKTIKILIFTGLCSLSTMQAMRRVYYIDSPERVTPAESFARMDEKSDKEKILLYAAQEGDLETTRALIQMGVPVDATLKLPTINLSGGDFQTPLMVAARHNRLDVCKFLVQKGADVCKVNAVQHGPLEWACEGADSSRHHRLNDEDRFEACRFLVEKMLTLPSVQQKERIYTFLMCMKRLHPAQYPYSHIKNMFKGHLQQLIKRENRPKIIERVNLLWTCPQQVEKTHRKEAQLHLLRACFQKDLALWNAGKKNDLQKVRALLHGGSDPDAFIDEICGITPLVESIVDGHHEISVLLLEAGASLFHQTTTGFLNNTKFHRLPTWSPLEIAFELKQYELCSLMIEKMIALDHKQAWQKINALPKSEAKSVLMRKHWFAAN